MQNLTPGCCDPGGVASPVRALRYLKANGVGLLARAQHDQHPTSPQARARSISMSDLIQLSHFGWSEVIRRAVFRLQYRFGRLVSDMLNKRLPLS